MRSRAEECGDGVPGRFEVARPDPDVVLERGRAAVSVPGPRGHHRDRHLSLGGEMGQALVGVVQSCSVETEAERVIQVGSS